MTDNTQQTHPLYAIDRDQIDAVLGHEGEPGPQQLTTIAALFSRYADFPGAEDIRDDLQKCLTLWGLSRDELNLKTRPLEALLAERPTPADAPNANQAWADLIVGELVRGGVGVFCVAPGSRSTPLTLAAERHPTARVVVCIDERSLGFYALGYGKGSGKAAAVISSSGTAVANLLPAAVEAHESCAPLLLLTADRPPELRDTGANQTIDQVKIFGSYARFGVDLAPPGDGSPARVAATAVATAPGRAPPTPPPRRLLTSPLAAPRAPSSSRPMRPARKSCSSCSNSYRG